MESAAKFGDEGPSDCKMESEIASVKYFTVYIGNKKRQELSSSPLNYFDTVIPPRVAH